MNQTFGINSLFRFHCTKIAFLERLTASANPLPDFRIAPPDSRQPLQSLPMQENGVEGINGPIALARPIAATFVDTPVLILELGASALTVSNHTLLAPDATGSLHFTWQGEQIRMESTVRSSFPETSPVLIQGGPPPFRTELAVSALWEPFASTLDRLLEAYAGEVARAQEANARGDRHENVIDGDLTLTAFSRQKARKRMGFVTYRLDGGSWSRSSSLLADQPRDGFTVTAGETDAEIEQLKSAYATGGQDERELIREMASISIRNQEE